MYDEVFGKVSAVMIAKIPFENIHVQCRQYESASRILTTLCVRARGTADGKARRPDKYGSVSVFIQNWAEKGQCAPLSYINKRTYQCKK
jgi:hypothetical protein